MKELVIKVLFTSLCVAANFVCAAQDDERGLRVPENFGIRETGSRRAAVIVETSGENPLRLLDVAGMENTCRRLMAGGLAKRLPTIDADVNLPDTVRVTRFMSPDGNAVADYSTHRTFACVDPETSFNPCHCRYGFVIARYVTVKLRVAGRLQVWHKRVDDPKVIHHAGANRSNAPMLLEQRVDPTQLGPVVGNAVIAGLRCELRQIRDGYACLFVAGDGVPAVLANLPASAGRERDLGSHHYRVTDVAVRALVDGAVFEPPAGVAPVSSAASRPSR
jgi:hypothetical protein